MIKKIFDYMGLLVLIILTYVFFYWLYATYAFKKDIEHVKDAYITEKEYADHMNYNNHTNDDLNETISSEEQSSSKAEFILEKSYNAFNNIRVQAGMIELEVNEKLEKSAQYHSDYLARYSSKLRYFSGHKELENTEGFRGKYAGDRAVHVGYMDVSTIEGLVTGDSREYVLDAVNGLMTAIYHRFSILTFEKDEIGIGLSVENYGGLSNYVHNLGNSHIVELCEEEDDIVKKEHYGVCGISYLEVQDIPWKEYRKNREENKKKGLEVINEIKAENPKYVLWPSDDSINNTLEYSGHESPAPIIDYDRTGNPISIQFNTYYFPKNIKMTEFKLYKEGEEVKKVRILTKNTDINSMFSQYEYALFPLDVLAKDSLYKVEFSYIYEEVEESISWSFKT